MRRGEAKVVDRPDFHIVLLGGDDGGVCFSWSPCKRLFNHAVLARFCGADDVLPVELSFGADADGIDVVSLQNVIQITDVFDTELLGGCFAAFWVSIPDTA